MSGRKADHPCGARTQQRAGGRIHRAASRDNVVNDADPYAW
jgi:hypothetical protein